MVDGLYTDLFPPNFKKATMTLLRRAHLATVLLKQPSADSSPSGLPVECPLLHPHELLRLNEYHLAKRRAEFLGGRICAKLAIERFWQDVGLNPQPPLSRVEIISDPSGRPLATVDALWPRPLPQISITHGGQYAAALAADTPCGIDLQQHKDNLLRVREKYCTLAESQFLEELLPEMAQLSRLSLLWTAKEAAKKALSAQQMPGFLELLLTSPSTVQHQCLFLTLAIRVGGNGKMPDSVSVIATIFEDYGLAVCILQKEQCYA